MDALISVIIPVYNVEAYLRRCVDSVLAQSYPELEILLVDDGSTDASGRICDDYAKQDPRITVIHKENGGLSDARNAALDMITGSYVVFIDSDDYVGSRHIQNLYEAALAHNADIAISDFLVSGSECAQLNHAKTRTLCYTSQQALQESFYSKVFSCSACGKLYRRELFHDIRYPKGMLFEDLHTTPRVMLQAKKVVFSDDVTYCYYQRRDSIVHTMLSERHFAGFDILDEFSKRFQDVPEILQAVRVHYCIRSLEYMKQLRLDQADLLQRLWKYTKENRWCTLRDSRAPARARAYALLSCLGPRITMQVVKKYYA